MEEEQKYHWRARYISSYFDANPKVIKEVSAAADPRTLRERVVGRGEEMVPRAGVW